MTKNILPVFSFGNPFPLYNLVTLIADHLTIYARVYFWALSSIPLICMSTFIALPDNFGYHSFVIRFEIRKCKSCNFVLFHDCFGYPGSLEISYKFGDGIFCSFNNHHWDVDKDCVKSVDYFGK